MVDGAVVGAEWGLITSNAESSGPIAAKVLVGFASPSL
jgi:hypothetical protein